MPVYALAPYLTKNKIQKLMKKFYLTPETVTIETKMSTALLAESATGGGISDDYSSSKDDNPSTDPDNDFGW